MRPRRIGVDELYEVVEEEEAGIEHHNGGLLGIRMILASKSMGGTKGTTRVLRSVDKDEGARR